MSQGFEVDRNWDLNQHIVRPNDEVREIADDLFVRFLDDIERRLRVVQDVPFVQQALEELFLVLREWKLMSEPRDWEAQVATCRRHPLVHLVHQDPFTYRAFNKPRGYAGDAPMMDFIYGREEQWAPPAAEELGRFVFN